MSTDPLAVSRLRELAKQARDAAHRARDVDVRRQYEDIAKHYDFIVEGLVAAVARRAKPT